MRDGTSRDATVLATLCGSSTGSNIPSSLPVILSTGDTALVEFVSDQVDQRQGFSATFQFVVVSKDHSFGPMTPPSTSTVSSGLGLHILPVKSSASAFGN